MTAIRQPVLYALVTGSPAARDIGRLVDLAQSDGWEVCVIASPDGRRFIDCDALAAKTGHVVHSSYKDPDAPDILPPADAMVVARHHMQQLAQVGGRNLRHIAAGLLVEAVGKRQPVVAMPFSNWAQIGFPAVQAAMASLAEWGVTVLVGDEVYKQHAPGTDGQYIHLFPWHVAWQAVLKHPRLPRELKRE
jgi:hypothetical protein